MKEIINNKKELLDKRRKLRNNATKEEKFLWNKLHLFKNESIKFRRQHSVGFYILDFYCPKIKLAIELDGSQHFTKDAIEYDELRNKYLLSLKIETIRFTNNEIKSNIVGVMEIIASKIKEKLTTPYPLLK